MPNICLPPPVVDAFKRTLVEGKILPEKLVTMTSEERHKLFSSIVGEGNAKFVNSTFEAKTLLKDQQTGYLRWAKKLTGVTPEVRRDLMTRIGKLDHVLAPAEEKMFLKDLASTKLGIDVTAKEATQITRMSNDLKQLASKQKSDGTFPSETDRMAYGHAKVDFGAHLADLKNKSGKLSMRDLAVQHPLKSASKVAGFSKALKASLDNSAIFRQGWKTLWTNPGVWQKNARKSFIDIAKQLGGKETLKEVQADIVSRPNYDKYTKMKLAIGNVEEEFPTTLPEKVPILGRFYKASEGAYTGFLYRQRADIADKMLQIAEKSGIDVNDKTQLESIGKLINSLTGRGHLGRFEGKAADSLNNIFFSARFLKSNFDTLTAHSLQSGVTPFVRKQAAINLVKVISGTAAIFAIANAIRPGSVELDPRSSNFGKIKVGHTTFDVTGGLGSIATLAARIAKQSSKNASTGVVSKLGNSYGQTNGDKVIQDFITGKLSPAAAFVNDTLIKHADFSGNKPTLKGEATNLFVPLPITTASQTKSDPHAANALLTSIADGLGIASNTNSPVRNISQGLSTAQQAFKDKVGNVKFEQANNSYNQRYNDWLANHKEQIDGLPTANQSSVITAAKAKIQTSIYKEYGFKPPKTQSNPVAKNLLQSIR